MASHAYTPEEDSKDPPRGRQRLLQATTLTAREGAPWEALHTALYWAQGSPKGPDTPEPTEAWVMQAKAMRNYHLHHPFDDSPAALPWPSDPPETVRKLADLMRSHEKANMQTPAEPPLRDLRQQATHPFFKPRYLQSHPSERDEKRAHPPPTKLEKQRPPDPPHPVRPTRQTRTKHPRHPPSHHYHRPTRSRHPRHPPSRHQHRPRPRRTQDSKRARRSSSPSATTTRATGSGVRAQSSTTSATWGTTRGHRSGRSGTNTRS